MCVVHVMGHLELLGRVCGTCNEQLVSNWDMCVGPVMSS